MHSKEIILWAAKTKSRGQDLRGEMDSIVSEFNFDFRKLLYVTEIINVSKFLIQVFLIDFYILHCKLHFLISSISFPTFESFIFTPKRKFYHKKKKKTFFLKIN